MEDVADRVHDLETRVRILETSQATITAQLAPLLGVQSALNLMNTQLVELKGQIESLRDRAVLLGGIATLVAPTVFAVVYASVVHFMK